MAYSPFDSIMFRHLLGDDEVARLFSDSAEIRAMLLVEGTLARVQGELGIIPKDSAHFIERSAMEVQVDPAGLAEDIGRSGVAVPSLVKSFRKAMEAPEHSQYIHYGATSQDIVDTALVLRLRQYIAHLTTGLETLSATLIATAKANRDTVMAARTRGQIATPTTFGARIAGWRGPIQRNHTRMGSVKDRLLTVSLAGASGNYAALGDKGREVELALAKALKLAAPETPSHSARDNITEFAATLANITAACGKIGKDILQMAQTEVGEVTLSSAGGSSTMPHKTNPVLAEILIALADHTAANLSTITRAQTHTQERDGAAWMLEWLALPQICIAAAVAVKQTQALLENMTPNADRMLANIAATNGLIYAEAATFALAKHMPRQDAQTLVANACSRAKAENKQLRDVLTTETTADVDWDSAFDPLAQTGLARKIVDDLS